MPDITKIDKNFAVEKKLNQEGINFYNPLLKPFEINGVKYDDGVFVRLPPSLAEKVSEGVGILSYHTAGGRIRFRTDSPYVAIIVKYKNVCKMDHFAFCGSIGFDLYADNNYVGTFRPSVDIVDTLESIVHIRVGGGGMREITINMPLYSSVYSIQVGLDKDAKIQTPTPYINKKPIVYYGSSTTQGGCASRPGTCYQANISRELNVDYINLGFSGSAKAEDLMIDYIKSLDMSAFVYDYDNNAPTVEHLQNTHEKMFNAIRSAHPNMPIIMMSRPIRLRREDEQARLEIVKATYLKAKANGDNNVYFLDGDDLTKLCGNNGTVDNSHPTDFGFASMSTALVELIKKEGIDKKLV